MSSRTEYVLDSSALIVLVNLEAGNQRVARSAGLLVLSNSSGAIASRPLGYQVEDWSEDLAFRSAEFSPFNKSHGLSLGDRACLTLAKQLHATAVTSDRAWRRLPSLGVPIMIFR